MTKPKIPSGLYCYSWIEVPSKKNNYIGKVEYCPYYDKGACLFDKDNPIELLDCCRDLECLADNRKIE